MVRTFNDHRTLQTVTQVDKNVILVWSGVLMITGHYKQYLRWITM
jgi:hypothetical protein